MPRKRRYKPKEVADALTKHKGRVFITAKHLRCAPQTVLRYIRDFPVCAEARETQEGLRLDVAEGKLDTAINRGDLGALTFILRTKGKSRGYVERTETRSLSNDDIKREIERELAELRGSAIPDTDVDGASPAQHVPQGEP
jgi:hypothetical protein